MGLFLLVMAGLFSRSEDTLSTDGEGIAGRARKENGVLKKGGGGVWCILKVTEEEICKVESHTEAPMWTPGCYYCYVWVCVHI